MKDKNNFVYLIIGLVVVIFGALIFARIHFEKKVRSETASTPYSSIDVFAQCISDSGAKFYGAYWCPHCQAQKKLFNESKKLPYVECSTADGQGQTKVCADAKVTGYPTWIFADGSIANGEQTFEELSSKTNCPVPKV